MPTPRWTITTLTIPSRERYAANLLRSLEAIGATREATVRVVYNWRTAEAPGTISRRLRSLAGGVPFDLVVNRSPEPTIASGRALQLDACRTPLVCFVDDDLTVHGDLLRTLDSVLSRLPLGLVGIPSFVNDTADVFKPRSTTPQVDRHGVRFMQVQGMLVAGYRQLLVDIGGFNPLRRFWGEWTELNLRMWRSGYPTAYSLDGAYLRHWEDAPDSPTRSLYQRHLHVLWGIICTAIEYGAQALTPMTESFWRLVRTRYLPYSFGESLAPDTVLAAAVQLAPQLSADWPRLSAFRDMVARLPFPFAPFHEFTAGEVDEVVAYAESGIGAYRNALTGNPA